MNCTSSLWQSHKCNRRIVQTLVTHTLYTALHIHIHILTHWHIVKAYLIRHWSKTSNGKSTEWRRCNSVHKLNHLRNFTVLVKDTFFSPTRLTLCACLSLSHSLSLWWFLSLSFSSIHMSIRVYVCVCSDQPATSNEHYNARPLARLTIEKRLFS